MMVLNSLTAIKRACQVGASLEIVEGHAEHLRVTAEHPRPVIRVQTNAICLQGGHRSTYNPKAPAGQRSTFHFDPEVECWLYWPKASEIELYDSDEFLVKGVATYRVIPATN